MIRGEGSPLSIIVKIEVILDSFVVSFLNDSCSYKIPFDVNHDCPL